MTEFFNDISAWSVLKWVIVVLIAGFIGQFGKTMAQGVMERIRRIKSKKGAPRDDKPALIQTEEEISFAGKSIEPGPDANGSPATSDKKTLKALAKIEKKKAKQTKK